MKEKAIKKLEEALKGEGAYNRDQLTHAGNTIESMKDLIREALEILKESRSA